VANKVIVEGFIEGGEVKLTDRFIQDVALYSTLSATCIDILLNTIGLRLGVATIQVSIRLETIIIRLNQYALTVKFEVYETITLRRGLSSTSLVEIYRNRLPSVSPTVYSFFQLLPSLMSGILWNYRL
jgi:hypothetical protein